MVISRQHLKNIIKGPLVLVLEDFYHDYEKACKRLIHGFESGKYTNRKDSQNYVEYINVKDNQLT